jgi:hypothetical protein
VVVVVVVVVVMVVVVVVVVVVMVEWWWWSSGGGGGASRWGVRRWMNVSDGTDRGARKRQGERVRGSEGDGLTGDVTWRH